MLVLRDALMSTETSTIQVSIIDIRPSYQHENQNMTKTATSILIGDTSSTDYLVVIDLKSDTIDMDKTYVTSEVKSKQFNGFTIMCTTIDTNISSSTIDVIPNISDVSTTLAIDLTDHKTITTTIGETRNIQRTHACLTCKDDLVDVIGTSNLAYCSKYHRHSFKKNIRRNISTTFVVPIGEEKYTLWPSDLVLDQLLTLVGVSAASTDTDIALTVLSYGNISIQYSELRKEILSEKNISDQVKDNQIQGVIVYVNKLQHYAFIKQ
ncbi:unnamed protein product [Rotaria sordida]|uniref:Uncharacterized protein n=1 Tax=Rotaria sordida TaxID=392033 RepID=A0A815F7B9_9BILA|nr:unnamed protein product [Rotaria sordida]